MTLLARIKEGHTDLVFEYLAQSNSSTVNYGELVSSCAYYGDVSAVKYLIAKGAALTSLPPYPLNTAAFFGHWRLCQFLIENGIDVNEVVAETGETPLHSALCHPNRPAYDKVVVVLLANGANPNVATKPGSSTEAFVYGRTKGETPLHRAAALGTEKSIELLLDAGAKADAKDANGDAPLFWASWHQRPGTILKKLGYGNFKLSGTPSATPDRGLGWSKFELDMLGEPHVR